MDRSGLESFPVASFDTRGVENSCSSTQVLVNKCSVSFLFDMPKQFQIILLTLKTSIFVSCANILL